MTAFAIYRAVAAAFSCVLTILLVALAGDAESLPTLTASALWPAAGGFICGYLMVEAIVAARHAWRKWRATR